MEKKWLYLIVLSAIWGTSFTLIKKGLVGLTQIQLGSLRTVMTAIILFSVGLPTLKQIRKSQWKWIALSALFGTFFPAFLFAFAQKQIDSAVASILNSLTPLATAVLGYLVFSINTTKNIVKTCIVWICFNSVIKFFHQSLKLTNFLVKSCFINR